MTASRVANTFLVAVTLILGVLLVSSLATGAPDDFTVETQISFAVLLLLSLAALKLRPSYKPKLCVALATTGITLLAAEAVIGPSLGLPGRILEAQRDAATKEGVPFDTRTIIQVVTDLRNKGVDAYFPASGIVEIGGEPVQVLRYISNAHIVSCNETGTYGVYPTDEHGFNNPKGIWQLERIEIASIGNSHVWGSCVDQDKNPTALIRNEYPNTINLGLPGAGALTQLAVVKEYVAELEPRVVLMFYWEGRDLTALVGESEASNLLTRYYDPDYQQNLVLRQAEIDDALREYSDLDLVGGKIMKRSLKSTITLRGIRGRIYNAVRNKPGTVPTAAWRGCDPPASTLATFEEAVRSSTELISSWGGRTIFVYLPTWVRWGAPDNVCAYLPNDLQYHDQVLEIAERLDLQTIDLTAAFDSHPDPLSLFPFRVNGHYNEEGYQLVADTILQNLEDTVDDLGGQRRRRPSPQSQQQN